MKMRKRSRILVSLLVLASVEVLLCVTGVLIPESWLASHKAYYEYYQPDDLLLYKVRPNLRDLTLSAPRDEVGAIYSTADQGFRNLGRDYSRAEIFFIGDSFVLGAWVTQEETLVSRIEAEVSRLSTWEWAATIFFATGCSSSISSPATNPRLRPWVCFPMT